MKVNGRPHPVQFYRRPPRIVTDRLRLGLPAAWPAFIVGETKGQHRLRFELEASVHSGRDEVGRRYIHPNFELLVFNRPHVNVSNSLTYKAIAHDA